MESFSITLKIDGKDKKFTAPNFIPGKLFRQASEIGDEYEGKIETAKPDLDKYFQFVSEVFGNKFDVDQFENGIDARNIMTTVYATVHFVVGNIEVASAMLSDGQKVDISKN